MNNVAKLSVRFGVFEANETMSAFSGSSAQFRIRIAVAQAGLVSIELIQPVSGVTLYSKLLETRGPTSRSLVTKMRITAMRSSVPPSSFAMSSQLNPTIYVRVVERIPRRAPVLQRFAAQHRRGALE